MEEKNSKKGFVIRKERLLSLVCGIFTLVFLFLPWYKLQGVAVTAYVEDIGDVNGLLGAVKVMAIIAVVISCLYILIQLVDMEKIVPGLKKFKFGFYRLAGLVFYGFVALIMLLAIIGSIASDYFDPTVREFILFFIYAGAICKFAVPSIWNTISKKINLTIE